MKKVKVRVKRTVECEYVMEVSDDDYNSLVTGDNEYVDIELTANAFNQQKEDILKVLDGHYNTPSVISYDSDYEIEGDDGMIVSYDC